MTEYEVKCPQTWAWYTAFVHDYDDKQKKLLLSYPDDWKSTEYVDINTVRYKFDSSILSGWKPRENEEVECKARAEEREPYGWWLCKSNKYVTDDNKQQQQDNLYNVSFKGWGDQHNEILSIDFIRPKSQSKILSARNMHRQTYDVPLELKEWVIKHTNSGEILDILMPHKNISAQIIHIGYLSDDNELLLIGNKRVLITMKDIIYCFFERQKTLLALENKTKKMELRSRMKREEELKAEKHTFNIHPFLSGYLRGKQNKNLQGVRNMYHGKIIKIDPQLETVYIAAKDRITLQNAVDQLQIVCKKVIIPKDEMGQIIGSKGNQIQDIKRKSEVIKIISLKKWPDEFNRMKKLQTGRYAPPPPQNTNGHTNGGGNDEGIDYDAPTIPSIIRDATIDNIFDDVVDLTAGYEPSYVPPTPQDRSTFDLRDNFDGFEDDGSNELMQNKVDLDALVIIGRRSRVDLCIFMIEMTLSHFRSITKTKRNVSILKNKINEIKGHPDRRRRGRYQQGYGQRQSQQQQNWDEQKDGSPPQQQQDRYYQRGGRGGRGGRRGRGRGRGRDRRRGGRGGGNVRQYQRKNYNNGYDRGYNDEQQDYGQQNNEYGQTERQFDDNNGDNTQQQQQEMQGGGDGNGDGQQSQIEARKRRKRKRNKKKRDQSQNQPQTEQQAST